MVGLSSPALASRDQPIEPIDLPPSVEQGVDMIYIDPEIAPQAARRMTSRCTRSRSRNGPALRYDLFLPVNPIYTELRRGLVRYQQRWGSLPQIKIPPGRCIKPGSEGRARGDAARAARPRCRAANSTPRWHAVVKEYQQAHGLKADGIVGAGMIASLNLGVNHYERLIIVNLERARRLPWRPRAVATSSSTSARAKLFMYENGRPVDSMKVIVGKEETATPMMAR